MAETLQDLRRDIVEVGRLVFQKGWIAANDGNISVRLSDGRILCTPTGVCKGMMEPDDLIICDACGTKVEGRLESTTELAMHLMIYRMRPDIHSILHAHPPVATGFAVARRALDLAILPEVIIGLGCVPVADYGLPGTPALTDGMLPYIPKYDAMLMANHGAVAYAQDVRQAYFRMETVEHFARITLVAELLGGARPLPREEVRKLFEARQRYGIKAQSCMEPGCPVTEEDVQPQRRFELTRNELVSIIDEALRSRGVLA